MAKHSSATPIIRCPAIVHAPDVDLALLVLSSRRRICDPTLRLVGEIAEYRRLTSPAASPGNVENIVRPAPPWQQEIRTVDRRAVRKSLADGY
jgi:hypothetical protein